MDVVNSDIDWSQASDDCGLIEACRAAASIAEPFRSARRRPAASLADAVRRFFHVPGSGRRVVHEPV